VLFYSSAIEEKLQSADVLLSEIVGRLGSLSFSVGNPLPTESGLYLECSGRECNETAGGMLDGSHPWGSRGRAPVGSGGEAPRSYRYNVILCL